MTRRLLNLLTALSLLLCVAAAALWVRSYQACDRLSWTGEAANVDLVASRGRAELTRVTGTAPLHSGDWPRFKHYRSEPREVVPSAWSDLTIGLIPGVHYAEGTAADSSGISVQAFAVSHSFALASRLRLPAARAAAGIRSRRRRLGLCGLCGYDLRATPDRCPECGHMPAATATTSAGGR